MPSSKQLRLAVYIPLVLGIVCIAMGQTGLGPSFELFPPTGRGMTINVFWFPAVICVFASAMVVLYVILFQTTDHH